MSHSATTMPSEDSNTYRARPRSVLSMLVPMVVGLVIGAAASWALLFPTLERATPWVDTVIDLILPALGIACGALVVVVPLTWWAVRRFVGAAQGTLDRVVREVTASARAAAAQDSSPAASHAEAAVLEVVAWYAPIAARRWVVATALGLLVAFGGLVGTALLFRQTVLLGKQNELLATQNERLEQQTELLRDQNRKLDLQTVTAEAQRRSGLTAELFSILQAISSLEQDSSAPEPLRQVSRGLRARIVTFSRAAEAYQLVELGQQSVGDEIVPLARLASVARSPERGQLLVGLTVASVDLSSLSGVSFESADLRGADLVGANLYGVNLNGADLTYAKLLNADLAKIQVLGADLRNADFGEANLRGAALYSANASHANFLNADLSDARLVSANLEQTNFYGADLRRADLRGSDLSSVNLLRAIIGEIGSGSLEPLHMPAWDSLPPGWERFIEDGLVRLRRSNTGG